MESKANRSSYIRIGVVVAVLILLFGVLLLVMKKWETNRDRFPEQDTQDPSIEYNGQQYVLNENVEAFLIIGLDKYNGTSSADSYNNDKQADFLMLLVFDNEAKQCVAIHINRDTMVDVNVLGVAGNKIDTVTKQIALAHTYGNGRDVSCHNTSDSVSSLLNGVKINHYLSATLDTVTVMNDLVGGVEVEILDDFSTIDESFIKGEKVVLQGEQALTYVRARQGLADSSNSARMKRQQQYVDSLRQSVQESIDSDDEFLVDMFLQLSDYIVSDRSVTQLQALAEKLDQYEFLGIKDIEGTSQIGAQYVEFYPDQACIDEMVFQYFYKPKA